MCVLIVQVSQEIFKTSDFLRNILKLRTLFREKNFPIQIAKIKPRKILSRQDREIKYP